VINCEGRRSNPHRGFYFHNNEGPDSVISGLTITNGWTYYEGGGIYCGGSSPTITNCAFIDNWAGYGGGMFNDSNSSPTLRNCTFSENWADYGGGMFNDSNSSPTLSNCTFMENWGRSFGGMWNFHSHPTVTHCAFKRNSSASGGAGMQNTHSNPTVTDCTFKDNSAGESYGYGGGMHNMWSHPAVTNCTFTNNSAPKGGGMRNHQGSSPIVAYCTFINNSAEYGGGMANDNDCRPTIVNCTFIDNSADCEGGGMYNHDNITTVTNCLFRANTANKYGGGGMYNSSSSLTITNCTFVENMAHNYGGGAMYNYAWGATTVMLNNCIFWANLADTGRQIMITRGLHAPGSATVTVHYSDFQGGTEGIYVAYPDCHVYWGGGNIDVGPLFVDSADGDYHLLPDSPCIDAGDPNSEFGLEPEPDGGRINMGAYGNTPEATSKGGLVLQSYNLVSKTRVGRTLFDYEFTVTLNNNGSEDVSNVLLELLDASGNVEIIDSEVNFAYIEAGEVETSEDTFSLRVDRASAIDAATISWRATFEYAGGGAGVAAFTNNIILEDIAGDITGEGAVDIEDLARLAERWLWVGQVGEIAEDIAPSPYGDGTVNWLDFAKIAEKWGGYLIDE